MIVRQQLHVIPHWLTGRVTLWETYRDEGEGLLYWLGLGLGLTNT
jgi:hypothetical protein